MHQDETDKDCGQEGFSTVENQMIETQCETLNSTEHIVQEQISEQLTESKAVSEVMHEPADAMPTPENKGVIDSVVPPVDPVETKTNAAHSKKMPEDEKDQRASVEKNSNSRQDLKKSAKESRSRVSRHVDKKTSIASEPESESGKDKDKDKDELHNAILLAALKLFADQGYFNTSLTEIAELSGVKNSAGIYKHFKNKQEIARALYLLITDRLSVSIDDIRRRNRKAREQLREIVDLWFKLVDDAPEVIQFLLVLKVNEFLPDEKKLMETAPFIKILRILHGGIKAGDIKVEDPQRAYCYFFGVIENTLKQLLNGTLKQKADVYQNDAWLIAWATIAKN